MTMETSPARATLLGFRHQPKGLAAACNATSTAQQLSTGAWRLGILAVVGRRERWGLLVSPLLCRVPADNCLFS